MTSWTPIITRATPYGSVSRLGADAALRLTDQCDGACLIIFSGAKFLALYEFGRHRPQDDARVDGGH